ncbi:MAG: hypothetical protein V1903_06165 [Bacteroidota bacterium]
MKTIIFKSLSIIGLLLILLSGRNIYGQDSIAQKSQMLDIKLQLLDSKLDLLDTKIKLWEAKPKELDTRLNEIDSKVHSMDFDPQSVTRKLYELDSLMKIPRSESIVTYENQPFVEEKPVFISDYKSAIMLDPVRLMEGTFYLSYERTITPSLSFNIGGMATYSTNQGISNYYFSNQKFAALDAVTNEYRTYQGEVISGGGLNFQFRNYLMANHPGRKKAPFGLYAAPQIMYRRIQIKGNDQKYVEIETGVWEWQNVEVTQKLNIYAGGVILGYKVPLFNALAIDIFAGGNIKLSGYSNEDGFTKYKDWFNIDFSGVSPVAGIAIGILK